MCKYGEIRPWSGRGGLLFVWSKGGIAAVRIRANWIGFWRNIVIFLLLKFLERVFWESRFGWFVLEMERSRSI